jgi:hypothetical protein
MERVAVDPASAQMESPLEKLESLASRCFVGVLRLDGVSDLLSDERADGSSSLRGEDLRLSDRLTIELDRKILF